MNESVRAPAAFDESPLVCRGDTLQHTQGRRSDSDDPAMGSFCFIDCFRKGVLLTKGDCIKYLLQSSFGLMDGHLSPVGSKRILLRMCNNLLNTYGHLEMTEEASRVQCYVAALTK